MTVTMLFVACCLLFARTETAGEACFYTSSCPGSEFCIAGKCRKKVCTTSIECREDETCLYGKIGKEYGNACFPVNQEKIIAGKEEEQKRASAKDCPGGGKVIRLRNGEPEMCDMENPCSAKGICNPQLGICCTRQRSRPTIGATCDPNVGCDGNSACVCDRSMSCSCQCPSELGYTADRDGIHCKRIRRRLKEKCKSNFECQAAYSECTSGGCRCRTGFQRDGKGGCKPTAYRCANKQEPLKEGEAVRVCMVQIDGSRQKRASISKLNRVTAASKERPAHNCPPGYYCVPVFDIPRRDLVYQGFCCPSPVEQWPVCPVGIAHKSSVAPFFGCDSCPADHFCHRDIVVTNKEICCPKPCVSIDDIYVNGECYPNAHVGESCSFPEQCVAMGSLPNEAPICVQGMCTCPQGYGAVEGKCEELVCSVGVGGTPSVDANNVLIPCSRSDDCAQGYLCDLTINLCCKGNNRCPKGSTEVGQPCFDGSCKQGGDICHQTKTADQKICCRRDP